MNNENQLVHSVENFIKISTPKGKIIIRNKDILVIEASSNYSIFHLLSGMKYITSRTLKYWASVVDGQFMRCHQSYLVNKLYIRELKNSSLLLCNNSTLSISRRYKSNVVTVLQNHN